MALDSETGGFLMGLGIAAAVAIVLTLVFSILRPKVPDVYYHRRLLNTLKPYDDYNAQRVGLTHPPPSDSFFGWITPLFVTPEAEVARKIGLDAAMFLRFLRTCLIILSIVGTFSVVVLMPVFGTGRINDTLTDPDDPDRVSGLKIVSLANVPPSNGRLWVVTVTEFIVAAVVIYFMRRDYKAYADYRREYRNSETPVNYALAVLDIPEDCRNEQAIRRRFELVVPGQISEVVIMKQCAKAAKLKTKLETAVTKREIAEYVKSVKGVSPQFRPGFCGCAMCHKPKVDALDYWQEEQDKLSKQLLDAGNDAAITPSAILVLSNKRAASVLAQANVATSATAWNISRAGEPNNINWAAFSVPSYQAEIRSIAVAAFVFVFTLFWTIPATAIAGLFSLEKLSKVDGFEWTSKIRERSERLSQLVEGLLPVVVMSVLISLIPTLFRFVVSQERVVSYSIVERKTRDYFYCFTVYGSFFVIILGSAFLQDLAGIIDDPVQIIDSLASGVPGNGIFFATFIVWQALVQLPLLISGVVRVILRFILMKISKTERQQRKARTGGGLFQFFRYSGHAMLIMFLSLMFTSFSPLVPLCGIVYFGIAFLGFKYMLLFSCYQPWEGGGDMYPGAYWGTFIGLILKQVVVIAVLGLKRGPAQAIVCIIPTIATIILSMIIAKRYERISEHGSLHDMFENSSKLDEIPSLYHGLYRQPGAAVPEFANLNGIERATDTYEAPDYGTESDGIESEHPNEQIGYVPDRAAKREEV
eukprot:TRINITY_DN1284_c0_g1_i1.p1 TRINITY_DN1284_c0_g1~~TRINITY_DN1284_c0_g1_i1.p1  ORF type:complete len:758 (+),score=117.59 TRINITY_DN1284_c0_g1_i1:13373-15646(+)